ncbi:MAG: GNAT family N-acetyltransferase [Promethearchaeota archaeon]
MQIRNVNLEDLNKIMALQLDVFKENAFTKKLIKNLIEKNTFFLKLETNDKHNELVGFIIVIRDRVDRLNIVNFLINPKFQNKGLGSLLLKFTLDQIKEIKEIKKVALNVQESNTRAIWLYEKFNFKKHPKKIENYYQSGESAYFMELNIDSL